MKTLLPALLLGLALPVSAQDIDLEALTAKIDARAGDYTTLGEILEGTDGQRALAAFDVMMESGNTTLAEIALTRSLAAPDRELRARALWEAISRRDGLVITVDTSEIDGNETALAVLAEWGGPIQTWPFYQKFPETQCINLYSRNDCYAGYNITISGLKLDIGYEKKIKGTFTLTEDGVLRGRIAPPAADNLTFPATIDFR
ncbi:hypothetical protein [Algicella marina]|uniref:Uncharacterized protein n=1 Tax=Algicella marina TaxID=2683284 RepID=A0A6P1ST68_9RHOB|nr:hypothetical protein [Algicella marina]QHQ33864.1 hypothetical protein GO499_01045 [Algicella marina]